MTLLVFIERNAVQCLCTYASPDELRARWADAGQRAFSLSASNGERAGVRCRIPSQPAAFLNYYAPEAREILNNLLGNPDSRTSLVWPSNLRRRWERHYASDGANWRPCASTARRADDRRAEAAQWRSAKAESLSHFTTWQRERNQQQFGGADQLRNAVSQLQWLLYAVYRQGESKF